MKRITIFLPPELETRLHENARRTNRSQAEVVREVLATYLESRPLPWPRSAGQGESKDRTVTSENVKHWIRERWLQEAEGTETIELPPTPC